MMSVTKYPSLLVIAATFSLPLQVSGQVTQLKLCQFTEAALRANQFDTSPPCFEWNSNPMQYYLGCVDISRPEASADTSGDSERIHVQSHSLYDWPVQEQFIVTLIRFHRNTPTQRGFWGPVLHRVEAEVEAMLVDIQKPNTYSAQQLEDVLQSRSERIHSIYQDNLNTLAIRHGYVGAEMAIRGICYQTRSHGVPLYTDPKGGQIYYMPQGQWELCTFMRANGRPDFPQPRWTLVAQADSVSLVGRNLFYVKWPSIGGYFFHNIRVTCDTPVTFSPDGIRLHSGTSGN